MTKITKPCEHCSTEIIALRSAKRRFCSHKCQMDYQWESYNANFPNVFWSRVDKSKGENECWPWAKTVSHDGYGRYVLKGKYYLAHRTSYELTFGKIPDGLVIDHLCRNTKCVNPRHLEAVTNKTNILRGTARSAQNARKTHCKRGHPLSGDNLDRYPDGSRHCRACVRYRYAEKQRANQ